MARASAREEGEVDKSRGEPLTDWDLVQYILKICGIDFRAEKDKSLSPAPKPYWISSPPSKVATHWHIFFSADGSVRLFDSRDENSYVVIGRPCTGCTAEYAK